MSKKRGRKPQEKAAEEGFTRAERARIAKMPHQHVSHLHGIEETRHLTPWARRALGFLR